jgi:hypothetical protein
VREHARGLRAHRSDAGDRDRDDNDYEMPSHVRLREGNEYAMGRAPATVTGARPLAADPTPVEQLCSRASAYPAVSFSPGMSPRRHVSKRLPAVAIAAWLVALTIDAPDAPATVEQQRARLPPAAECSSPVTGKWKALSFDERRGEWYEFILEVHQDAKDPSVLSGMIYVDMWVGPPDSPEPPNPCELRYKGTMPAKGTFTDGEVQFGGTSFQLTEEVCGSMYGYNPDNFTGKLQPELQEFQSVNNDGGAAVNEPTVFRRIGCFDDGRKDPGSDVKPPPFFPHHQSSGC